MMRWLWHKLVYWLLTRTTGTWIGAPDQKVHPKKDDKGS